MIVRGQARTDGARTCLLAFLLLALPLGLWFAVMTPLGDVADEPAHLMRAAALLDGSIVGHRETITLPDGRPVAAAGILVDPVWEAMSRSRDPVDVSRVAVPAPDPISGTGPWGTERRFHALYTIGTYFPAFYAPAALGLAAGRIVGATPRQAATLGRLAALLTYVILACAALALTRRGRLLLFVTLALPMSLSLAGSFNHDGLIIATSALAAALLTRVRTGDASARLRHPAYGFAAISIALVVLAKPPYAPLALALLLPLTRLGLLARAAIVLLAVLPGILWAGFAMATVATPVPRTAYEAGPLWPGLRPATFQSTDPKAQLNVLAAAPARLLTLPAGYLFTIKHMIWLARTGIGCLGWLDRPIPALLYGLWPLAFFGALQAGGRARAGLRREGLLLLMAGLACLWAILLSQYLTWTNVGESRIDGPQGRYLLPLLPLIVPLLAANEAASPTRWRRAVGWLPYLAAGAGLTLIPALMQF